MMTKKDFITYVRHRISQEKNNTKRIKMIELLKQLQKGK
jgi:hypothetical protein